MRAIPDCPSREEGLESPDLSSCQKTRDFRTLSRCIGPDLLKGRRSGRFLIAYLVRCDMQ